MILRYRQAGGSSGWPSRVVLALGLTWALPTLLLAQKPSNWRVYRAEDGLRESYVSAVTLNPKSKVWATHRDVDSASWVDGYAVKRIPAPLDGNFRIYESPSGQIWALHPDGVQEYHEGVWHPYRISEVIAEFKADPLRRIREISLVPAERDRVLLLVSDRLIKFDIVQRQSVVLRLAGQTGLGRFGDMIASRDNGVWITGDRGVARLPGPIRRIASDTDWQEFLLPADVPVRDLLRPSEDDRGGLTLLGTASPGDRRVVVYFDGAHWEVQPFSGESLRQSWRAPDGAFWGMTLNALLRFEQGRREIVEKEGLLVGRYLDVAVGTNGAFWLATSEGLIRYAPLTWQSPPGLEKVGNLLFAAPDPRSDRVWFATSESLGLYQEATLRTWRLPQPEAEPSGLPAMPLAIASDGQVILELGGKLQSFNPLTQQFREVARPGASRLRILGPLRDGRLCFQAITNSGEAGSFQIEAFDGAAFRTLLTPPTNWNLGAELTFVQYAQRNDLWFGAAGGVALCRGRQWHLYRSSEGFSAGAALCALDMGDGRIWIGGRDGIAEFDGKAWRSIGPRFDRVQALWRGSDGRIWAATGNGLFREEGNSWVANGVQEGLPTAAVLRGFEDRSGRIWAVTADGLSVYRGDADPDGPRVDSIRQLGTEGEASSDNAFTFAFSARDKWKYTPQERLLFSHRLDDGEWSPFSATTSVTLPEVSPGDHRFEVRAMDRNWRISASPEVRPFTVMVPWFREPRLLSLSGLALVVTVFLAGLAFNRHRRLLRSYAEVGRIVAQRTRELELANQELLHSQKMKALGTLAAGIAHDFNSILSIIKGSAQIIESNLENKDKIRTRVERIQTMVDQGSSIVKAMLGYSRADKNLVEFNLAQVVEETLHLLGDKFLHSLRVTFAPAGPLAPVRGSKELIQQILLNLIFNAADAMEGLGELTLRTGTLEVLPSQLVLHPAPASGYVFVSVADTGCGIPPEILPRIFEPFFTTKSMSLQPGTGLGLSMVYEFAREMGYGLRVESELDRGTTFTIIIPRAGAVAGSPPAELKPAGTAAE